LLQFKIGSLSSSAEKKSTKGVNKLEMPKMSKMS